MGKNVDSYGNALVTSTYGCLLYTSQLATDSVYYLLSRRCGLDPMELLEEEDFMHITDYNSLSVLTFLGNAANQLSESVLIDIGKTVHKISLEEARKEVEKSNEMCIRDRSLVFTQKRI